MFSQALRLDPFVQNGKSAVSESHTKESTVNQRTSNPPTLKNAGVGRYHRDRLNRLRTYARGPLAGMHFWTHHNRAGTNRLHNFRHAEFIKRGKNRVAKSSRLATVHSNGDGARLRSRHTRRGDCKTRIATSRLAPG